MRKLFIVGIIVLVVLAVLYFTKKPTTDEYSAENAILGIRGFRHSQLFASGGKTEEYEVGIGEEFKVLWIIHQLASDGQIIWRGPEGVGNGTETIKAGEEITGLKVFTASKSGMAEFVLTTTGPDKKEEINKIIVLIK